MVVKGNFEIDSSVQIAGQPSMMNPAESEQASAPTEKQTRPAETHAGHGTPESKAPPSQEMPMDMKMDMGTAKPHSGSGTEGH